MLQNGLIRKAKTKWVQNGDENSRFFHNSLKLKYRMNNFQGLKINDVWIIDVEIIKMENGNSSKINL